MPDPRQLPYLLRLLDDDSPEVRAAVMEQFAAFGEGLEAQLEHLVLPDGPGGRRLIESLLREGRRRRLADAWQSLPDGRDAALLEAGMELVSRFLRRGSADLSVARALDLFAAEFRSRAQEKDALALAEFLFRKKGLAGARTSYHDPRNSDLLSVIERKEGLPISLCCIYILVAHRLGLRVEGCNLPGHFLALAAYGERTFVVDCYNRGTVILDSDLARLSPEAPVRTGDLIALRCDAGAILTRVLRNLGNAFRRGGDEQSAEDAALMERLAAGAR